MLATGAGAVAGGSSGAATGSSVHMYNDEVHCTIQKCEGGTGQLLRDTFNNVVALPGQFTSKVDSAISQFTGLMNKDAAAKASERPSDLMAQGTANGINTVIGSKGGEPPMANPGTVLVDSTTAQRTIAGKSALPENAIIAANGQTGSGPEIEDGKQGKHQPGHNNFTPGKSELTYPDPQQLANEHAGTGQPVNNVAPGGAGFKERVDFGKIIGNYVDPATGEKAPITNGIIHYSKDGVHIVPSRP